MNESTVSQSDRSVTVNRDNSQLNEGTSGTHNHDKPNIVNIPQVQHVNYSAAEIAENLKRSNDLYQRYGLDSNNTTTTTTHDKEENSGENNDNNDIKLTRLQEYQNDPKYQKTKSIKTGNNSSFNETTQSILKKIDKKSEKENKENLIRNSRINKTPWIPNNVRNIDRALPVWGVHACVG